MAKGFITLENGKDFFTRWTGYDMIIEIIIKELEAMNQHCELAKWLKTRIPAEGEHRGDAVFHNNRGEMIQRTLDLRGLTQTNRDLFWKALEAGNTKIDQADISYSNLNPERLHEFYEQHRQTPPDFEIEAENNDTLTINNEVIEKIGPGWI
ncbi:MAG: hypothetical protein HEP71_11035 [Roseivirga sp.]|nr:hypothetical protein [Roseivirga sp.]